MHAQAGTDSLLMIAVAVILAVLVIGALSITLNTGVVQVQTPFENGSTPLSPLKGDYEIITTENPTSPNTGSSGAEGVILGPFDWNGNEQLTCGYYQNALACYNFDYSYRDDSNKDSNLLILPHNGYPNNGARFSAVSSTNAAAELDGEDDYIEVLDSDLLAPQSMTISFWIRKDFIPDSDDYRDETIIRKGNISIGQYGIDMHYEGGGYYFSSMNSVAGNKGCEPTFGSVPKDTSWHFIAQTRDSNGQLVWYIDGIKAGQYKCPPLVPARGELFIGNDIGSTELQAYRGELDQIEIYPRVLSLSEISQMYFGQRTLFSTTILECEEGCILADKCIPYGSADLNTHTYCQQGVMGVVAQKNDGASCYSSAECYRGACSPFGKCTSSQELLLSISNGTGAELLLGNAPFGKKMFSQFDRVTATRDCDFYIAAPKDSNEMNALRHPQEPSVWEGDMLQILEETTESGLDGNYWDAELLREAPLINSALVEEVKDNSPSGNRAIFYGTPYSIYLVKRKATPNDAWITLGEANSDFNGNFSFVDNNGVPGNYYAAEYVEKIPDQYGYETDRMLQVAKGVIAENCITFADNSLVYPPIFVSKKGSGYNTSDILEDSIDQVYVVTSTDANGGITGVYSYPGTLNKVTREQAAIGRTSVLRPFTFNRDLLWEANAELSSETEYALIAEKGNTASFADDEEVQAICPVKESLPFIKITKVTHPYITDQDKQFSISGSFVYGGIYGDVAVTNPYCFSGKVDVNDCALHAGGDFYGVAPYCKYYSDYNYTGECTTISNLPPLKGISSEISFSVDNIAIPYVGYDSGFYSRGKKSYTTRLTSVENGSVKADWISEQGVNEPDFANASSSSLPVRCLDPNSPNPKLGKGEWVFEGGCPTNTNMCYCQSGHAKILMETSCKHWFGGDCARVYEKGTFADGNKIWVQDNEYPPINDTFRLLINGGTCGTSTMEDTYGKPAFSGDPGNYSDLISLMNKEYFFGLNVKSYMCYQQVSINGALLEQMAGPIANSTVESIAATCLNKSFDAAVECGVNMALAAGPGNLGPPVMVTKDNCKMPPIDASNSGLIGEENYFGGSNNAGFSGQENEVSTVHFLDAELETEENASNDLSAHFISGPSPEQVEVINLISQASKDPYARQGVNEMINAQRELEPLMAAAADAEKAIGDVMQPVYYGAEAGTKITIPNVALENGCMVNKPSITVTVNSEVIGQTKKAVVERELKALFGKSLLVDFYSPEDCAKFRKMYEDLKEKVRLSQIEEQRLLSIQSGLEKRHAAMVAKMESLKQIMVQGSIKFKATVAMLSPKAKAILDKMKFLVGSNTCRCIVSRAAYVGLPLVALSVVSEAKAGDYTAASGEVINGVVPIPFFGDVCKIEMYGESCLRDEYNNTIADLKIRVLSDLKANYKTNAQYQAMTKSQRQAYTKQMLRDRTQPTIDSWASWSNYWRSKCEQ